MKPIGAERCRLLVLGTLPGDESLRRQQYYAHPRNQFWRLIAAALQEDVPAGYDGRIALLDRHGIAVWDVLRCAAREGSLDGAIRDEQPNNFSSFLPRQSSIELIAFNGQRAAALFRRHVAAALEMSGLPVSLAVLPSSSPAATRPFAEKLLEWQSVIAPARRGRAG